jgi:hypothetical protein
VTESRPNYSVVEHALGLLRFYSLLKQLAEKMGGPRELGACVGRMNWPRRGVYFFFEDGEFRTGSGVGSRVVRVGTHALKTGSRSTLRSRLAQHRGGSSNGNHRGSVFRKLVGLSLIAREPAWAIPSWGSGASAPKAITMQERELEARVSAKLATMRVLCLAIDDEPGKDSLRGFVERNAIALLSAYGAPAIDPPSPDWLGRHCPRERIRESGLWNSDFVDIDIEPTFIDVFEKLIESIPAKPDAAAV